MALEAFSQSRALTLGIELELQLVSRHDYDLIGSAADLLGLLAKRALPGDIKPEMTSSMIEVATGICTDHAMVVSELTALRDALNEAADVLNIGICGGGTHPYQHWGAQQIFEAPRFHYLSDLYGYLAKQFTVFGQHVHIGCSGADEALCLLHGLSRYIPHFIALSASSPFVQGYDSGFDSARLNSVAAFPMSGRAPFVESWRDFATYFESVAATGVVKSMKDFYWDIRPKPEFGTIEVRVMDTPLSIETAAEVAVYIQSVARWLTIERPFRPREEDYLVYTFNRFQACRFGYAATYIDPETHVQHRLSDHIRATLGAIEHHAIELGADKACGAILGRLDNGRNDAGWLRAIHAREHALPELVRQQCLRWRGE
jgi:carboxylate-amine ligase